VINYNAPFPEPPSNVDWVAIDPYINEPFDNTGCTDRAKFDERMSLLAWAVSKGKPVVIIGQSFHRIAANGIPEWKLPSTCQQSWFVQEALSQPSVVGFLWFMYGDANIPGGEVIRGAGQFPETLKLHRELWDNVRYGGWGATLAAGDLDGDGRDEIVVGQGEGPGSMTGLQAFRGDGTPIGAPFRAYAAARFGVSIAVAAVAPPP
jgi:hypothetical protein